MIWVWPPSRGGLRPSSLYTPEPTHITIYPNLVYIPSSSFLPSLPEERQGLAKARVAYTSPFLPISYLYGNIFFSPPYFLYSIISYLYMILNKHVHITPSNGYLGSRTDEERSELR